MDWPEPNLDLLIEVGGIGSLFADLLVRRGEPSVQLREAFLRVGGDPTPFDQSQSIAQGTLLARVNQAEPTRRLDELMKLLGELPLERDVDRHIGISADVRGLDLLELERRFAADVAGLTTLTRHETLLARLYVGLVAHGKGLEIPSGVEASLPANDRIEYEHVIRRQKEAGESQRGLPFLSFQWAGGVRHEASDAWISQQSLRRRAHLLCEEVTGWRGWLDL